MFWTKKLKTNKERDRLVTEILKTRGWRVIRIWQHELNKKTELRCVRRIEAALNRRLQNNLPSKSPAGLR
jgi:DNA mismatch endonuclease (patch repair protein)